MDGKIEPATANHRRAAVMPGDQPPMLLTVIHTEEEFDWTAPFDRRCDKVTSLRDLGRAQDIFSRHDACPTYMIDYPVAAQDAGVTALQAVTLGANAMIGAHLHPWVTPPFDEIVSGRNSYPGNLPRTLEHEKLRRLTERIFAAFAVRPTVYLAGRYGFGANTLSILQELGYRIDLSGVAMTSYAHDEGPDYSAWDNSCFWEGDPAILRIPHSVADAGFLCRHGRRLFQPDAWQALRALRLPGILARLGAMERVRLSPEGFSLDHLRTCAATLIAAGVRVLVFSFHSPSLVPGFTPYVRDSADLAEFLRRIDGFLRFFREELGGVFRSPYDVLSTLAHRSNAASVTPDVA